MKRGDSRAETCTRTSCRKSRERVFQAVGTAVQRSWGKGGLGLFEKQKDRASSSGKNMANKNIHLLKVVFKSK